MGLAKAEELAIEPQPLMLKGGMVISFPCSRYPRLTAATHEQRENVEISPLGLHWTDVDEDLSIRGLLHEYGPAPIRPTS